MRRPGFTILEVAVAVVVLGVIGAVTLPLVSAVTGTYSAAVDVREKTERVAFALDRCVRLLRETPAGADATTVGIASADANSILFDDGRGLELAGTVLLLRDGSATAPLCREVTAFTVSCLGPDGVTSVSGAPASTHSFRVSLTADGVTLSSAVFPRCRMIKP